MVREVSENCNRVFVKNFCGNCKKRHKRAAVFEKTRVIYYPALDNRDFDEPTNFLDHHSWYLDTYDLMSALNSSYSNT